jgi:lipopolysaccharide transport system permease protein
MVVFSIFIGLLAPHASQGVPFSVFVYSGIVVWTYFANTLGRIGNGLVEQQGIITRVYFPRLLIPLAALLGGLVDFAIAAVVLVAMLAFFRIPPSAAIWTAPLFLALAMATALGVGLWLAALNVEYRDVQQIIPFLLQAWIFATPVFYSADLVAAPWRTIYGLNPMVGVVEGFRWSILGKGSAPGPLVFVSVLVVIVVLMGGLSYFRRVEENFADVV